VGLPASLFRDVLRCEGVMRGKRELMGKPGGKEKKDIHANIM